VLITACDLLKRDAGEGMLDGRFRIDAQDELGAIVYSVELDDARAELLSIRQADA
jgi:hypothetical protein